jgi:hypothetical protein
MSREKISARPVYLGLSVFIFSSLLLPFIAGTQKPLLLYYIVYAAGVWAYVWFINHRGWNTLPQLTLFGLGMYMEIALMLIILSFSQGGAALEYLATAVVGEIVLIWYARRILKS